MKRVTKEDLVKEIYRLEQRLERKDTQLQHLKEINDIYREGQNANLSLRIALEKTSDVVAHVLSDIKYFSIKQEEKKQLYHSLYGGERKI
jgi:hypothetical protein